MVLASRLFAAVSQVVYEEFGETIWNFNPDNIEQEESNLDTLFKDGN